jgi:hypothetical protein
VPLTVGALGSGLASLLFVLMGERWLLFRPQHAGAVPVPVEGALESLGHH